MNAADLRLPPHLEVLKSLANTEGKALLGVASGLKQHCCRYTDWATGRIGAQSALSYAGIARALTEDIPRKPNRSLRQLDTPLCAQ